MDLAKCCSLFLATHLIWACVRSAQDRRGAQAFPQRLWIVF